MVYDWIDSFDRMLRAAGVRSPAETCLSRGAFLKDGENFGQTHFIYESAAKLNLPENSKPFTKKKGYVMKMGINLFSAVPM